MIKQKRCSSFFSPQSVFKSTKKKKNEIAPNTELIYITHLWHVEKKDNWIARNKNKDVNNHEIMVELTWPQGFSFEHFKMTVWLLLVLHFILFKWHLNNVKFHFYYVSFTYYMHSQYHQWNGMQFIFLKH